MSDQQPDQHELQQEENKLIAQRKEKLAAIREQGGAFPNDFRRDNLCADLAREFAPRRLTSRFSPGYGDFPLSQQAELCAVLNVNRLLGITLTPGGLMVPQKSVTALIGVSEDPEDPSV